MRWYRSREENAESKAESDRNNAKEKDGNLYVGFRFSPLFGLFENGEIDVTVPTKGKIKAVVLKTRKNEYVLTERQEDGSYQRPYHGEKQEAGEVVTEGEGET